MILNDLQPIFGPPDSFTSALTRNQPLARRVDGSSGWFIHVSHSRVIPPNWTGTPVLTNALCPAAKAARATWPANSVNNDKPRTN